MKRYLLLTGFSICTLLLFAQQKSTPTLKSILLEQLKSTHNAKEWFVPANTAVAGLTPEQAMWKDSSGNHSVAQLTAHLIFWNLEELAKFNDEKKPGFNGNNDETFSVLDKAGWDGMVKKLDSVLTAWENAVEKTDDAKLQKWYTVIAHIGTHNAYHIGQMIFIRKLHGTWNPENGVK
jgi:hypothetical protein